MSKYIEKEIFKILKDLHGITEEELDQNSKTIVEIVADIIQVKLFEIKDRSWLNVGEIFSDNITNSIIMNELKTKKLPKNIMVLAIGEFKLNE